MKLNVVKRGLRELDEKVDSSLANNISVLINELLKLHLLILGTYRHARKITKYICFISNLRKARNATCVLITEDVIFIEKNLSTLTLFHFFHFFKTVFKQACSVCSAKVIFLKLWIRPIFY